MVNWQFSWPARRPPHRPTGLNLPRNEPEVDALARILAGVPRRSLYEWFRRHPYVLDVGIVCLLGLFMAPVAGSALFGGRFVELLIITGLLFPLIWRRRHPVAVFTVISLTCAAQVLLFDEPLAADFAFLFALYGLSAYGARRVIRNLGLATGFLAALLATLDWWGSSSRELFGISLVLLAIVVAFTWTLGDLLRTRRAYVGELEERARSLELERDQQAQIARSAERARIAREMHDVVAHSLSIVVAQADGGLYAGERDPAAARDALATIGTTGRRALAEMRRLLGVLRSEAAGASGAGDGSDAAAAFAPQPGLAQLEPLLDGFRSSGLSVRLEIVGEPWPASGGVELAVYRIVQEALTNTLKHGGPKASATVRLSCDDAGLRLEIADDGRGAIAIDDGAGNGLTGMRERVTLYGGSLRAGPRAGGGFKVVAELPETAATAATASTAATDREMA